MTRAADLLIRIQKKRIAELEAEVERLLEICGGVYSDEAWAVDAYFELRSSRKERDDG